nr:copia protein [Tanacetum cinerariifolium]
KNDSENLGKLQPKADIGIFIGYAPTKKAFSIYNRHTRRIVETIHVDFDELTEMASEHRSSGLTLHEMTHATITPEVIAPINEVIPPVQDDSTNSPSSTTVDQDAPSASKSHTTTEIQSPIIPQEVKEDNMDIEVAHIRNDPLLGVPIQKLLLLNLHQRGIFINQSKYALESLKKYGFESCDPMDTQMVKKSKLDVDKKGKAVDPSHYRVSRPDLQFAICMCAQYQARPTEKHVHAVKRIIRYLRGTVHRGLWYPKDSSVALTAFADADYTGCQDTRRSTSALGRDRIEFLINKLGMRSFTPETLKKLMDEVDE